MKWLNHLRDRFAALRGRPALDALLAHASHDCPLAERVAWAEDLLSWVRRGNPVKRLRLFLQLLERQPDARPRVARTLHSLVKDTQALDLFADTGLPRGVAFTHELMSRLVSRLLPDPPDTYDLADIFDRLFPDETDADWLEQLDPELARRVVALFEEGAGADPGNSANLCADLEDAMVQLADRICVVGSHREVRDRLGRVPFRELPFQKLPSSVEALIARRQAGTPMNELAAELNYVRAMADGCDRAVDDVVAHLEKTGVSTRLVYDIERLRAQVKRLELLLEAWSTPDMEAARILTIVADLVRQNHARRSVRELCRQNLRLLTQRIVERNAETGEHYVARTRVEYRAMLRSAAGGGVLMGLTTLLKLLIAKLTMSEFLRGATYGLNYAAGFVLIQLCGFTVATKQPAATAPALARRMEELRDPQHLEALVDEVVFLIRSQIAAVFGNLLLVVPVAFLLDLAYTKMVGQHVLDMHKAELTLQSVSLLSACWFYAAFTGILLWLSSLFAAWMDNWFVLNRLGPALAQHRALQRWFGPTRTRQSVAWLEHNIAGLAGNISLGLMLGIVPAIAIFLGLPLDVRHVTLSTGQATMAWVTLSGAHFWTASTLWVVIGILGVGALNILVSFSLALFVAIRARNVRGVERRLFYRALVGRALRSPLSFILPAGKGRETMVTP